MFAPSIGRAVRSASCLSAVPANSLRQAAFNSAQTPFRQWHQRRLSSSKPSVPPENKKKPNPKVERSAAAQDASEKKVEKKSESKKPKAQTTPSRNNRVASPSHLSIQDANAAASLAPNRPFPLHNGQMLPEVDKKTFEKLMRGEIQLDHIVLQAQELQEMQVMLEVLQNAVDAMQARIAQAKAEPGIAPTERSIHAYVERMPPFTPPPPPIAFDPFVAAPASLKGLELRHSEPERYTEVQLPLEQEAEQPITFRDHVRQRRGGMLLISVKRQRKLKMKKHKYKKLMKRTRLLRRKLDRT